MDFLCAMEAVRELAVCFVVSPDRALAQRVVSMRRDRPLRGLRRHLFRRHQTPKIVIPEHRETLMTDVLFWTGAVTYIVCSVIGMLWLIDKLAEWFMESFNFKRQFLAFVWDRLKAKRNAEPGPN